MVDLSSWVLVNHWHMVFIMNSYLLIHSRDFIFDKLTIFKNVFLRMSHMLYMLCIQIQNTGCYHSVKQRVQIHFTLQCSRPKNSIIVGA